MTTVNISSNAFEDVAFPLVLADRFFHLKTGANGDLKLDVFRWDPIQKTATYEVRDSEALAANIDVSPNGVVVFASTGGGFEYKFRPDPGVSQIFGKAPLSEELKVVMKDRAIRLYRNGEMAVDVSQNRVSGFAIGVQFGADGSMVLGSNALPEGMTLVEEDRP